MNVVGILYALRGFEWFKGNARALGSFDPEGCSDDLMSVLYVFHCQTFQPGRRGGGAKGRRIVIGRRYATHGISMYHTVSNCVYPYLTVAEFLFFYSFPLSFLSFPFFFLLLHYCI